MSTPAAIHLRIVISQTRKNSARSPRSTGCSSRFTQNRLCQLVGAFNSATLSELILPALWSFGIPPLWRDSKFVLLQSREGVGFASVLCYLRRITTEVVSCSRRLFHRLAKHRQHLWVFFDDDQVPVLMRCVNASTKCSAALRISTASRPTISAENLSSISFKTDAARSR